MKNIIALSPIYTDDSNNLKKASINSPYELNRFNAKWSVPEEFRSDVIAVYGEDIYAEMERLRSLGFEILNAEPKVGADNKLICFVHPKSTSGVLVELCQERK
jgi:hypothetical protein